MSEQVENQELLERLFPGIPPENASKIVKAINSAEEMSGVVAVGFGDCDADVTLAASANDSGGAMPLRRGLLHLLSESVGEPNPWFDNFVGTFYGIMMADVVSDSFIRQLHETNLPGEQLDCLFSRYAYGASAVWFRTALVVGKLVLVSQLASAGLVDEDVEKAVEVILDDFDARTDDLVSRLDGVLSDESLVDSKTVGERMIESYLGRLDSFGGRPLRDG